MTDTDMKKNGTEARPEPEAHPNKNVYPMTIDSAAMTLYLTMRDGGNPSPTVKDRAANNTSVHFPAALPSKPDARAREFGPDFCVMDRVFPCLRCGLGWRVGFDRCSLRTTPTRQTGFLPVLCCADAHVSVPPA